MLVKDLGCDAVKLPARTLFDGPFVCASTADFLLTPALLSIT